MAVKNLRVIAPQKTSLSSPSVKRLPIFPLPIFLLSGGIQRLRIFEPKYLSMIATAAQGDGFVICVNKKKNHFSIADWGTHVKIIDFNMGDDDVLTIDVLAERLVNLLHVESQSDGVLVGDVITLSHWSSEFRKEVVHDERQISLAQMLKTLIEAHPELNRLYQKQYYDYSYWVCARLLEIVPLTINEKEAFIQQLEFEQLTDLLSSAFEK